MPVSGCRFMRSQILECPPERRAGERQSPKPRVGEREHAPIPSRFERDQFSSPLRQWQNVIPLPEPGLSGGKRNFRHELFGNFPERLEIARRERTTKLIIADLDGMCMVDINSHRLSPSFQAGTRRTSQHLTSRLSPLLKCFAHELCFPLEARQ